MTILSELEARENLSEWGKFYDLSKRRLSVDHKRAFDYGFNAGLQFQLEKIRELEAKVAELEQQVVKK